jgi:ribonuclease HI
VTKQWTPPPPDVLKINSVGDFIDTDKRGAWGFVIRDGAGQGVLAGSGRLNAVYDALAAEGEACLAALYAAMSVGISRIIVETDSSN